VGNLDIEFPFEPYDIQKEYMSHLIQAIENKENALLESPTGTGKTLSFICASLAWQRCEKERRKELREKRSKEIEESKRYRESQRSSDRQGEGSESEEIKYNLEEDNIYHDPKIIICSRTHSQLTQIIKELKTTNYTPKTAVLASRSNLCINPLAQGVDINEK